MKWFQRIRKAFEALLEEDIENDYVDDGRPFRILSQERSFLPNSAKGDFRLYRLHQSFCACWYELLVVRSDDGNLRYELPGWGRAVAISPDKSKLLAARNKQLAIFNAATGQMIGQEKTLDAFIDFLLWLPNEQIAATDGEKIYLLDQELELKAIIHDPIDKGGFIAGMQLGQQPHEVIILDFNHQQLRKIDLRSGAILKESTAQYAEQLFRQDDRLWTALVNGTQLQEIRFYSLEKLEEKYALPFRGKKGIRFANQPPSDISYHHWTSLPVLSPEEQFLLVNDNAGLLWLLDAHTGDHRRTFSPKLLPYVYACLWLNEEEFVALLEDGFVAKMNIRSKSLMFKQQDFDPQQNRFF
ncbi:hypothetical protein [Saprospira grandis]|uniref:hypothetical protein n=1 Tax=Saprospira grandis TaxID=1008 RepID=UPI0022DE251C|nr:hypothetical protein [Saprospira grandis]WBM75641.1 hypothetical protein OP864_05225 [Saprospira grandis]